MKIQGLTFEEMLPLLEDETLGAGNFVWKSYDASPYKEIPYLFVDVPYLSLNGVEYKQFSLQDVVDLAKEISSFYHQNGVQAKDIIAVYTDDTVENFLQYVAINSLGAIPTFVNGALDESVVRPYLNNVNVDFVYTDIKRKVVFNEEFIQGGDTPRKVWIKDDMIGTEILLPSTYPFIHDSMDPVLLTHTSGTTGIPKTSQTANIPLAFGLKKRLKDREPKEMVSGLLNMLPHTHAASILYLMEATIRGCRIKVHSDKTPEGAISAVENFKPDYVLSFPSVYVGMLRQGIKGRNLKSVEYWRSTGDAAHEKHIRMLCKEGSHVNKDGKLIKGSKYIDGLGSTELGAPIFTTVRSETSENYLRCVGKKSDYSDVKIFGEDGLEVGINQVGLLGVKSPTVIKGYWNNSKKTEQSRINGYQTTGDLVYFDEEGYYYHLDRDSDTIETSEGVIYSLFTEEVIMRNFDEVFDCSIFKCKASNNKYTATLKVEPASSIKNMDCLLDRINECLIKYDIPKITDLDVNDFTENLIPIGVTGKVLKRQLRKTENS